MGFVDMFLDCVFHKYNKFDGRARRKEYWSYALVHFCLYLASRLYLAIFGTTPFFGILGLLVIVVIFLGLTIPGIAVTVRRLHDTSRTGWWIILSIVPIVNFYLLYLLAIDSDRGDNAFGVNPKGE